MPAEIRWDDLQMFLVAYRTRSLTRAAGAMGLNQSTTSRRLTAFEESLGARLFDRTPQGLVPTAAAERLLSAAESAEAATHEALRALDGTERALEGEVRLAVSDGMAAFGIAPVVPRLRARHPAIVLSLVISNAIADLSRREADLAVRFVRPERGDLVTKRLFEGGYGLFAASPDVDPARGIVGWDEDHAHLAEARWEQRAGLPVVARASTVTTRIALARSGCGAIALPLALGRLLEGLAPIPGAEVDLRVEAWLVTHRALREVPRVRAVWELLDELFAELIG